MTLAEHVGKRFTVRYKSIPGSLIAVVDDPELEVQEICPVCEKQGIIYAVHPETGEHKGSSNFKPFEWSPARLRALADILEKEQEFEGVVVTR